MGYSWKRTRYVPSRSPDPEEEREAREELEGPKKGLRKERQGEIVLSYLDESGSYLCLPATHTWTLKGTEHQHRVRSRWGSQGRISTSSAPSPLRRRANSRKYRVIEGSCHSGEVVGHLDALAQEAQRERKKPRVVVVVVMVMDNAPFHTGRGDSRARGVRLGGQRAEIVPAAGLPPASEPDRGCMAKAQGLPDAKTLLRLGG